MRRILALISLVALIGGGWYFWPEAEPEEVVIEKDYGTMEDLTRFTSFRAAYLEANGGEEQMENVQSVRTTGQMEIDGQTIPFFSLKRRPNQSLTTLKMPEYELTYVVNGDQIWQRIMVPGKDPILELKTGDQAEEIGRMGVFFDPLARVLIFGEGAVESLSPSSWMGTETIKIEFQTNEGSMRAAAYVEVQTMHPLALIEELPDGRERKVIYSDYRSINGMQEPFLIENYLDDELQSRTILEDSRTNVGTVASLFEYPESEK